MKKRYIIVQIVITVCVFSNCPTQRFLKPKNMCHQGHIYTIERQPIQGLRVFPSSCRDGRCAKDYAAGSMTDENGFFKFMKGPAMVLAIEYEGEIIDSIYTLRGVSRRARDYFVKGRADTFFIDMTGETRGFESLCNGKRGKKKICWTHSR